MDIQQIITFLIVGVAAVYLGRYLMQSARALFSAKSDGCAGGCGNCAFAPKEGSAGRSDGTSASRSQIIPLTEIRTVPAPRDRTDH